MDEDREPQAGDEQAGRDQENGVKQGLAEIVGTGADAMSSKLGAEGLRIT